MLNDLLKAVTPETLVFAIKSNPLLVQKALHNFESYKAFAEALTNSQQMGISSNIYKLANFFRSDVGKHAITDFTNEFIEFAGKK